VTQQQQQQQQAARVVDGAAAAAVAAAGRGVLCSEGERWTQNAMILARQQAREMQQQNDALVRVLERERQDHARTRQQVGLFVVAWGWVVVQHSCYPQDVVPTSACTVAAALWFRACA
jgi:hypothetical protein